MHDPKCRAAIEPLHTGARRKDFEKWYPTTSFEDDELEGEDERTTSSYGLNAQIIELKTAFASAAKSIAVIQVIVFALLILTMSIYFRKQQ